MSAIDDATGATSASEGGEGTTPKPLTLYTIPAGTKGSPCRATSCRKAVYWVKSDGKNRPLDPDPEHGGKAPTSTEDGSGVIHFATCTTPEAFRRPRQRARDIAAAEQRELKVDHRHHHCVSCGCSAEKRCQHPLSDYPAARQAELVLELGFASVDKDPDAVPVTCTWLSLEPPICSAPNCQAYLNEMPATLRLKAVASLTRKSA